MDTVRRRLSIRLILSHDEVCLDDPGFVNDVEHPSPPRSRSAASPLSSGIRRAVTKRSGSCLMHQTADQGRTFMRKGGERKGNTSPPDIRALPRDLRVLQCHDGFPLTASEWDAGACCSLPRGRHNGSVLSAQRQEMSPERRGEGRCSASPFAPKSRLWRTRFGKSLEFEAEWLALLALAFRRDPKRDEPECHTLTSRI